MLKNYFYFEIYRKKKNLLKYLQNIKKKQGIFQNLRDNNVFDLKSEYCVVKKIKNQRKIYLERSL